MKSKNFLYRINKPTTFIIEENNTNVKVMILYYFWEQNITDN